MENLKRHKLGYAITAGFIAVLRERTPGVVQRVNLANQVFNVGDAMTTAQSTVTLTKLHQALTNSFGDQVDGITTTLSSATKAVSDATSEITFEKFSKHSQTFYGANIEVQLIVLTINPISSTIRSYSIDKVL